MHYFHPLVINDPPPRRQKENISPYPPIDTKELRSSSTKMLQLTMQARLLIDKINNSPNFAYNLMEAAQTDNKEKVNELIKSTGITSKVKVKFNPSGIHLEFSNAEEGECCKLQMGLQW